MNEVKYLLESHYISSYLDIIIIKVNGIDKHTSLFFEYFLLIIHSKASIV
jgi:hypothetical protein